MHDDPSPGHPHVPPLPASALSSSRRLVPAWVAAIALTVLLGFVLVRNFMHDRRPLALDSSEFIQKEQAAIAETKTAFSQYYSNRKIVYISSAAESLRQSPGPNGALPAESHPATAGSDSPHVVSKRGRGAVAPERPHLGGIARMVGEKLADDAINDWRELSVSPTARAGAWRRLGIALCLFNRSGGMAAFRHIPHLPPPAAIPVAKPGMPKRIRDQIAVPDASTLPSRDEQALWATIYGPTAPHPGDTVVLRAQLSRLRLGWFEDVAAAQMYNRAGMQAEAARAARQAHRSADSLYGLLMVEGALRLLGLLLLIGYAILWTVVRIVRAIGDSTAANAISGRTGPDNVLAAELLAVAQAGTSAPEFSYRARLLAFVVYFGSYILIAWPLQLLTPLVARLPDQVALRLDLAIDLLAYVPITGITLLALKTIAGREQRRRITWRETWRALGFGRGRYGRDLVTAVVGYTMTVPVILLAAHVSEVLFRHFHTPIHPVDLIILHTQDGVTRSLVLVQACICAPIVEEMMFRGLLFDALRMRWGLWCGAILSATVFSLAHNTLPGGFLQLWTLGFVFALVFRRNRSLIPNILMHGIHNGLVTFIMFAVFSK